MNIQKYCLWISGLIFLVLICALVGGNLVRAHASESRPRNAHYYGADLKKMTIATGIDFKNPTAVPEKGPWPQSTDNYCFPSVVQAMVNYADLKAGLPIKYPTQNDQGPASGNPDDAVQGQILYDMDHAMQPLDGPLTPKGVGINRRPFTLANIAYDFGGDPRSQAFGTAYEAPNNLSYHEHIYHTDAQTATLGIAKALATYSEPVIALVNHAEHSVIVAGVWATGDPKTDSNTQVTALAVYNPWDEQKFGTYLSTTNYSRVSYDDWIGATDLPSPYKGINSWFNQPYQSNNGIDPDPSIGIYQAGEGTSNPDAHHWIGNYVIIQRDDHSDQNANFTYDENDNLMLNP